jgi:magnesium-protoporphyrin O-methyltransferase
MLRATGFSVAGPGLHAPCQDVDVPCSCCTSESLDIFGEKGARRELRRYLSKGLGGADARLIAAWAAEGGLDGAAVIEVGGGIGQIQVDLLRRGAMRGTIVEVLGDYRGPAGELAAAAGVADRSSFVLADLVETPEAVEPADVVVLRRVVCCSPDGPELLAAAAGRTRQTLLASYPRDRVAVRVVLRLQNMALALMRKRFRVFVHAPRDLEQAAARRGLCLTRISQGIAWETVQFDVVTS